MCEERGDGDRQSREAGREGGSVGGKQATHLWRREPGVLVVRGENKSSNVKAELQGAGAECKISLYVLSVTEQ